MDRGSFATTLLTCVVLVVLSVAVVVVLLGLGSALNQSSITRAYFETLKFIYAPTLQLMAPAFDRLPLGGWVVGFVYFTAAITIQNLLMWFVGKLALEQLRR